MLLHFAPFVNPLLLSNTPHLLRDKLVILYMHNTYGTYRPAISGRLRAYPKLEIRPTGQVHYAGICHNTRRATKHSIGLLLDGEIAAV